MKLHLPYSFFALFFFAAQLQAQPSFHYLETLTVENGLSSNTVTDVAQDGDGYLWIGTSYGLNRYDGSEVIKFFTGKNNALCDNEIRSMLLIDSFHLAIATSRGLSILATQNNTFRNIYFDSKPELHPYSNSLKTLAKDKYGNLWVASLINLYKFDSSLHLKRTFERGFNSNELDKTRVRYIQKIIPLESGDVLLWSFDGILKWNHLKDEIENIDSSPSSHWNFLKGVTYPECFNIQGHYLLVFKFNRLLLYDEYSKDTASCYFPSDYHHKMEWQQQVSDLKNGWLAFSLEKKGVTYLKISHESGKLSILFDTTIHFSGYTLRKWLKDNEGNWWVTTGIDGLKKISPAKQLFYEKKIINPETGKQSSADITGWYKFAHRFFISTSGDGFYELYNGDKTEHFIPSLGTPFQNIIWNIRLHKKNILWVGTGGGLLSLNLINHKFSLLKLPHPSVLDYWPVTTQYTDSKGLVWMGIGSGHGLCVFNPITQKFTLYPNEQGAYPFRYPLSIAEDKNSNLWFLSDNTHDLAMWNRKTNEFQSIYVNLSNGKINFPTGNMYLDKKGTIWYGVAGFGLISYNIYNKNIKTYGIENGLNANQIYNITEDKTHRLWLNTDQGLSLFDPSAKRFVNYKTDDGFPSKLCSSPFFFDSSSQKMFTGAPGKIIYFSPQDFDQKTTEMKVKITQILVNNKPRLLPENTLLKLSPHDNNITVFFTGINLSNGLENKYEYRFGKKDPKWIEVGNVRQISFASLEPGSYNFAIRSARKNGNWSSSISQFSFKIRPPFTSTLWFYLIILAAVTGSIYAWYRYRLVQLLKLEKIRMGISHDLHDEIGSRLTNISMMSLLAEQGKSLDSKQKQWLGKIKEESQAVSQSMREIVWNINPDNDSLEEAFPRMLRYTTDMLEAKGIEVKMSVNNLHGIKLGMEKRRDLFLIFKEVIQNVLKHSGATSVYLNLNIRNPYLFLKISDNGKGFEMTALPFLNGLRYMKQRAAGHHWGFDIKSAEDRGTEVSLKIKIK